MVTILGSPGELRRTAIENTLARGRVAGEPEPSWVAVEGPDARWLRQLFLQTVSSRQRGIAAVASDQGLEAALRAGVGGAVWLPPSTARMTEALRAAASGPAHSEVYSVEAGTALLEMRGGGSWLAVTFAHLAAWRHQLGVVHLERLLTRLAERIGVRFVLVEGPVLFLEGCGDDDAVAQWEALSSNEPLCPWDGLRVAGTGSWRSGEIGDAVHAFLASRAGQSAAQGFRAGPLPVFELPSGRQAGWWRPGGWDTGRAVPDSGWIATGPEAGDDGRFAWTVRAAGERLSTVPEVTGVADVEAVDPVRAVRMPGWTTADLRAGTPGGLLLERLVKAANARGLPLWVPNVTDDALRRLLQVGGKVWIDGPAVPLVGRSRAR